MTEVSIKHAAILAGTQVFIGKSHAECFQKARKLGVEVSGKADHQGFLTNKNEFVDRKEAARIAVAAGQVNANVEILFSEDLWLPKYGGRFKYDQVEGYIEGQAHD